MIFAWNSGALQLGHLDFAHPAQCPPHCYTMHCLWMAWDDFRTSL